MDWKKRIEINPGILVGKPIIKGTRISIEFIMELLSQGWTKESILKNYPQLDEEDITAALKYSTEILKQEKVYALNKK